MLTSGAVGRGNNQNYKVFLLQVIVAVLFVCFSFKTYAACKVSGRLLWLIHCGGLSWVYRNLELSTTDDELGGGGGAIDAKQRHAHTHKKNVQEATAHCLTGT